jgi:hypothetical protein
MPFLYAILSSEIVLSNDLPNDIIPCLFIKKSCVPLTYFNELKKLLSISDT